jgi:hypothetical protein
MDLGFSPFPPPIFPTRARFKKKQGSLRHANRQEDDAVPTLAPDRKPRRRGEALRRHSHRGRVAAPGVPRTKTITTRKTPTARKGAKEPRAQGAAHLRRRRRGRGRSDPVGEGGGSRGWGMGEDPTRPQRTPSWACRRPIYRSRGMGIGRIGRRRMGFRWATATRTHPTSSPCGWLVGPSGRVVRPHQPRWWCASRTRTRLQFANDALPNP